MQTAVKPTTPAIGEAKSISPAGGGDSSDELGEVERTHTQFRLGRSEMTRRQSSRLRNPAKISEGMTLHLYRCVIWPRSLLGTGYRRMSRR
ncbi:MAG: hypothetical protein ACFFER_06570 [Candidatus Thorarchaeota archaeon]